MEDNKTYDITKFISLAQFCDDAKAAAKAYLAWGRITQEINNLTASLNQTITTTEERVIADTHKKIESKAHDLYCTKKKLPIIIGIILYVIGVIIAVASAEYIEIWPTLFFIGLGVFRLTDFYEDLDTTGKIINLVVSLISIGLDCLLVYFFIQEPAITVIFITLDTLARISADIVPIARRGLHRLYIKKQTQKVFKSKEYFEKLKNAQEYDKHLTERSHISARERINRLRDDPRNSSYLYYQDFCRKMLGCVKSTVGYNPDDPNIYQKEHDIMIAVIKECSQRYARDIILERDVTNIPLAFFTEAWMEYNKKREKAMRDAEKSLELLDQIIRTTPPKYY